MSGADFTVLAPVLILAGAAVAVLMAAAFRRHHALAAGLTLAGLGGAGLALPRAWALAPRALPPLLDVDHAALFYTGLILAAAFVVALFSRDYFAKLARPSAAPPPDEPPAPRPEEHYVLLLLATAGAVVLVWSAHFASLFLGLELLSVSLYALVAYARQRPHGVEAGVKYLVLAGTASAFLLFGMSLLYAQFGTMELGRLAKLAAGAQGGGILASAGGSLLLVGLAFKLSLAPFHLWTPDVYQGAPVPTTAFIATVSKGAVLALVLRYAGPALPDAPGLASVLTALAIASMFAGNGLALFQTDLKRLLAGSSIAHMGYALVALLAGGRWAATAVAVYLGAYFITTLGAFGVLVLLSTRERDAEAMDDCRGLAWRRPWPAAVLCAMILSLAGIPLTAGFVGKFYVMAAGVHSNLWLLLGALALNSAIGLFYYLRFLRTLFEPPAGTEFGRGEAVLVPLEPRAPLTAVALGVLTLALLGLGAFPGAALDAVKRLLAP